MNREEAIKRLKEYAQYSYGIWHNDEEDTKAFDMAIEALSADDVQGEWIHDGQNFKGGLDWCHCSVCGQKTSTNGLSMYNFCPNCGARMTPYKGGDAE